MYFSTIYFLNFKNRSNISDDNLVFLLKCAGGVKYTLDFEDFSMKSKLQNVSLISFQVGYMLK